MLSRLNQEFKEHSEFVTISDIEGDRMNAVLVSFNRDTALDVTDSRCDDAVPCQIPAPEHAMPKSQSAVFRILLCILAASFVHPNSALHAQSVRERAVVDLAVQSDSSQAGTKLADMARRGAVADTANVIGGRRLIAPVFGQGNGGHAVILNPAQSQYISVNHSADVSRPDAVTVSGLFASLHAANEKTFRGLFAKRQPAGKSISNYGINFDHSTDVFQLYVNDGNGYRIARYSVKQVLGSRRRVHLTACFATDDAPGEDAGGSDKDGDADDIQVRLFVNGKIIKPMSSAVGFVHGNTAWFTDIALEQCVSDTPLTIGSSFASGELLRLIADDILVFDESLSDQDAGRLFHEVCGSAADSIIAEGNATPPASAAPQISRLSTRGVQVGKSSRLVVTGEHLSDAELNFSVPGIHTRRMEGGTAERVTFQIDVAENVAPARCLLRAVSANGVSNGHVFCVDNLPQAGDGVYTETSPLETLPVAVSGILGGTDQKRVWFRAGKGDLIVAEVEARRLASGLDPVVEIKNRFGAPLAIQWQQTELGGDARARVSIPEDGLYFAEVHDIKYRAPGNSHWRMLLGTLHAASLAFPLKADGQPEEVVLLGSSDDTGKTMTGADAALPIPPLALSDGQSVVEPESTGFADTPIDATFAKAPFTPMSVWGRISSDQEVDSFHLKVTAGQDLHFAANARKISSPLRPVISIYVGDQRVAQSNGGAGAADPALNWKVPDKVETVRVELRDFTNRGSDVSMYRVDISRSDRPGFSLSATTNIVELPQNGSTPLRLKVTRQTDAFRYFGPIRLNVRGASGIRVVPAIIDAAQQNSEELVLLVRDEQANEGNSNSVILDASTVGLDVDVKYSVRMALDEYRRNTVHGVADALLTSVSRPSPALISASGPPPILFRGANATIPVSIFPQSELQPAFVRYQLQTNQPQRREKPNDPKSPFKPTVMLEEFQFSEATESNHAVKIVVPLDTPETTLTAVVAAEFVEQPLATAAEQKSWTAPIQLPVRDALTLAVATEPAELIVGSSASVTVKVSRHPLFQQPVRLIVNGLPGELSAEAVSVAADHGDSVELTIVAQGSAKPGAIPDVTIVAVTEEGAALTAPQPLSLNVTAEAAR